jgi:hypothetical protein
MFQHRSKEFDPRLSSIAGHLRAIEKELGGIGKSAGRRVSESTTAAGNQIADAIRPILNDVVDRFGRGQRLAVDEAASFGSEAVKVGARVGSDVLEGVAAQAKQRPIVTLAVGVGVGFLIGAAAHRNWDRR